MYINVKRMVSCCTCKESRLALGVAFQKFFFIESFGLGTNKDTQSPAYVLHTSTQLLWVSLRNLQPAQPTNQTQSIVMSSSPDFHCVVHTACCFCSHHL